MLSAITIVAVRRVRRKTATVRLGLLAPLQTGLLQLVSPFLNDIYAATLTTVHLAVRGRTRVLYLERLSGRTSVPVVSRVGSLLPMYATGVGKVLLPHAPADVQERVLANLSRITSIVDPATGADDVVAAVGPIPRQSDTEID